MNTAQHIATALRAGVLGAQQRPMTPAEAEVMMTGIRELERLAIAGHQAAALGNAAASVPIAPMPKARPKPAAGSKWAKHEHLSREGKPPSRESVSERRAREQAESIGMVSGRFTGTARPGRGDGR